ncbi:MAG TPA: polyphenol oxidase family protein [Vicinamibacterales bacterium]|nr:polyphenol oxidase family protein [Vicinamibacterales bacterium]
MPEVPLAGGFEWALHPFGPALRCGPLHGLARHCFTTRAPALGRGPSDVSAGWLAVAGAMGLAPDRLFRLRQVHGTAVVALHRVDGAPPADLDWSTGDILMSDRDDVALCVRVADCVPILLADRASGVVAAVHAGWRGTAAGAAAAAVESLASAYGVRPRNLVAAIGPSIGPCCYRVGAEVRDEFEAAGRWHGELDRWFSAEPSSPARCGIPGRDPADSGLRAPLFLDTWAANADQLRLAGVPPAQVHALRLCTSCYREVFHSHRVDGDRAGRMAGVIRKRPGPEGREPASGIGTSRFGGRRRG